MNFIYKASIILASLSLTLSSCASFLDIVPDEVNKVEDTYADKNKGLDYLYSCYAYVPDFHSGSGSLDLMTGDEVTTGFEHEAFAGFPKGNYSASKPGISYWNTMFKGIRQCYMFLEDVDKLPTGPNQTTEEEKADYKAQLKFLIAYQHYLLIRCYGPVILVKSTPNINMKPADYPSRSPLDECVDWVAKLLDEAAEGLPVKRDRPVDFGKATKMVAKAIKAKLLLYAASPLFNGGDAEYAARFKDKDGVQLMPLKKDPAKWERAKQAIKEAIDLAEANGIALYAKDDYELQANLIPTGVTRRMRTLNIDWKQRNPEVIFADTRDLGGYSVQNKSYPWTSVGGKSNAWNGIAPTWAMLNRFYTKNGLPWDEDPDFKDKDKYEVVTVAATQEDQARVGEKTIAFNLEREPRFYAWVGFQGGYYEICQAEDGVYTGFMKEGDNQNGYKYAVVPNFFKDGEQGQKDRNNNYSPTGYLNKKYCDPTIAIKKSGGVHREIPWSVIRLGDLYLMYAEACAETNDLANAKLYTNKIRERAGIPTVEKSWEEHAGVTIDQQKMVDIVRGERMVELYLENQNFWDMRRWLLAGKYFNVKAHGLNIEANNINDFAQDTEVKYVRRFTSPTNYFLPIPQEDINNNAKLFQNPGY